MKLTQSLFLLYYSAKFKTIEFFSPSAAAKSAFQLFCTPYSRRKIYAIPEAFKEAEKLTLSFQTHTIQGFLLKPKASNGLKILICHGFDSFSYKFERYIEPLLNEGFQVFAFDAPAHGLSSGKTINALLYSEMIIEVSAKFGPFDGVIAHSFGGLAAALAIETIKQNIPKRLVLVAPATETTRSVSDFCRHLKISADLKKEIEKLIVKVGGQPAEWFSVSRIIQAIPVATLWVHDINDKITPFEDMKHLTELHLTYIEFVITKGLGHSLYRDETVALKIVDFLSGLKNMSVKHGLVK